MILPPPPAPGAGAASRRREELPPMPVAAELRIYFPKQERAERRPTRCEIPAARRAHESSRRLPRKVRSSVRSALFRLRLDLSRPLRCADPERAKREYRPRVRTLAPSANLGAPKLSSERAGRCRSEDNPAAHTSPVHGLLPGFRSHPECPAARREIPALLRPRDRPALPRPYRAGEPFAGSRRGTA